MPSRTLGPYEILAMLGRGGVGTVYRARHLGTGREVALKLLAPLTSGEAIAVRRLAREFEALKELEHPNVVRVYEVGLHEGYSFLAMELIHGLDLRSYFSPVLEDDLGEGPPPESASRSFEIEAWSDEPDTETLFAPGECAGFAPDLEALIEERAKALPSPESAPEIYTSGEHPVPLALAERLNGPGRTARLRDALRQVCAGLAYVHARGLVHRDLKPTNIMVDDTRRVRLMDFGLVKLSGDTTHLTQHGRIVGTYRYMAPEQARGEPVDHRADLYSLGVILFELLVGRAPFSARKAPELWDLIIHQHAPAVLTVNPGADPQLARITERLLSKDPRARFQGAEEIAAALSGA